MFLALLCMATAQIQFQQTAPVPLVQEQVNVTRAGLDEDYRLAELLIARTRARRAEAARLQAAAAEIELNNARLREFLCQRFCRDTVSLPVPLPGPALESYEYGLDRMGLQPAPPIPVGELDLNVWRGARMAPIPAPGINVQVAPRYAFPAPTYRTW